MKKIHNISNIKFKDGFLLITIDGEQKSYPLKEISPILDKASGKERKKFEISPSGYGIHWPQLDEDISIDGLLGVNHNPQWRKKDCIA